MLCWLEEGQLSSYTGPDSGEEGYEGAKEASDIMSQPVHTIEASASLSQAEELMRKFNIAHLAVLDRGQFAGLLSDRDILMAAEPEDFVGSHMSTKLLLASQGESIAKIASVMVEHHIHCLPVLSSDCHLVGMITTTDILGCMTYQAPIEFWC